jgi:hypothetical protein
LRDFSQSRGFLKAQIKGGLVQQRAEFLREMVEEVLKI